MTLCLCVTNAADLPQFATYSTENMSGRKIDEQDIRKTEDFPMAVGRLVALPGLEPDDL
jgi:hypothetical protein